MNLSPITISTMIIFQTIRNAYVTVCNMLLIEFLARWAAGAVS